MGEPVLQTQGQYQLFPSDGYLTIKLSGEVTLPTSLVSTELGPYLREPMPHLVINCESVSLINKEWLRFLLQLQQQVKTHNRSLVLLGVMPTLQVILKREGLDTAFRQASTLHEVLAQWGLATKKKLDTDFINPFLDATLRVLQVQARVESKAQKMYLKKPGDKFTGDVSGIIGIVSETFNGSVVISFPEATFLKVMSNMLGENVTGLSGDILDGAGEITNMVFGMAKVDLNAKGYGIKTALPSVVSGKDHQLTALTTGPCVVLPFTSSAGDFFVEICLSS